MKKIFYTFLFLFFILTQGYSLVNGNKIGERRISFNQIVHNDSSQFSKMNVGYPTPIGINITDRNQINRVFNFLKKQEFIKQEVPWPTNKQDVYRFSFFIPGSKKAQVNVIFDAMDGKSVNINGKYYILTKKSANIIKELILPLEAKEKG